MKILTLFAFCLAAVSAFVDLPTPSCIENNVNAGNFPMPHERFCQLFYFCDGQLDRTTHSCPEGTLFTFTFGISNCLGLADSRLACPTWNCDGTVNTQGLRFPDVCCNKYWECTSAGLLQGFCPPGTTFDSVQEQCVVNSGCQNFRCLDDITPSNNARCHDLPSDDGNPCTFKTVYGGVTTSDRPCPDGVSFNQDTCSCSDFNQACNNQFITFQQAQLNKQFDPLCQASRRMEFNVFPPRTVSNKLNLDLNHYFIGGGVLSNNNELIYSTPSNSFYLYDYFFNDNEIRAPFALRMTFRIAQDAGLNSDAILISNEFTLDPNNNICRPATFQISFRYNGLSGALRTYTLTATVQGSNLATETVTGVFSGDLNDYYTLVFIFDGTITINIYNIGIFIIGGLTNPVTLASQTPLGDRLLPNKCGFVIGRNFAGRISEVSTFEGCGNFPSLTTIF